jgi:hypothetical protein
MGKPVMSGAGRLSVGRPGGFLFPPLLFLVSTSWVPLYRLWMDEGAVYYTYDFFYWGEVFFGGSFS